MSASNICDDCKDRFLLSQLTSGNDGDFFLIKFEDSDDFGFPEGVYMINGHIGLNYFLVKKKDFSSDYSPERKAIYFHDHPDYYNTDQSRNIIKSILSNLDERERSNSRSRFNGSVGIYKKEANDVMGKILKNTSYPEKSQSRLAYESAQREFTHQRNGGDEGGSLLAGIIAAIAIWPMLD